MKKELMSFSIIAPVFFTVLTTTVKAQNAIDSINFKAGWGNLNYAVPESPAFKILDVSATNIMRPSSTKDIAVSIGDYFFSNGKTIPKNLAVEIAPSLFKPKVSLDKYEKNRLWYTSTFSIGTKQNQNKSYALALGLKFRVIDKADLRTNHLLIQHINKYGSDINAAYATIINKVAEKHKNANEEPIDALARISTIYDTPSDPLYKQIKKEVDDGINEVVDPVIIPRFRDSLVSSLWNARVLTIGIATLSSSKDSSLKNITAPSKHGLWATLAEPIGKKGQILIGVNSQLAKDTILNKYQGLVNLGFRAYLGRNNLKGYLEGESSFKESNIPTYRVGVGMETTFFGGLWIQFGLGAKFQGHKTVIFDPAINIFFANGEKNRN